MNVACDPCSLVQSDQHTVSIFSLTNPEEEATRILKNVISLYQAARRHASEDRTVNIPFCKNTECTEFGNGCTVEFGPNEDFSNTLWWRVIEDLLLLLLLIGGGGIWNWL